MSAQETVGKILTDTSEVRDAIHFAVIPVVANESLWAGCHIRFAAGSKERVVRSTKEDDSDALGLVDPFLTKGICAGERFWMFLLPNTITSLRHVWEHPAFDAVALDAKPAKFEPFISPPEKWLREYAVSSDIEYDKLMQGARDYLKHGDYIVDGGRYEGMNVPDQFWEMFEMVENTQVADDDRGTFFSCSC